MELMDSLKGFFSSPDSVSALSDQVSESPQKVGTALSAAIPTLVAALGSAAQKPEGARAIMNAVDDTDTSVLSRGADLFRGGQSSMLADRGASTFSSLFGGGMGDGLISLISRFSGIGGGSAKRLIRMVLPVVLGFIGKSASSAGVRDAQGLSGFLSRQSSAASAAMPQGLSQLLPSIPGLSSLTNMLGVPGQAASRGYGEVSQGARAAASTGARWWPVALVLLLLIGAVAWWLWPHAERAVPVVQRPVTPAPALRDMDEGARDVGAVARDTAADADAAAQQAGAQVGDVAQTWLGDLSSLNDPTLSRELTDTFTSLARTTSSATEGNLNTTQDQLSTIADRIAGWRQTYDNLPPDKQSAFSEIIRKAQPSVEKALTKVRTMPGTTDQITGSADRITQSLRSYTARTP